MHQNKHKLAGWVGKKSGKLARPMLAPHGWGAGLPKAVRPTHAQPNHALLEKERVRKIKAKKRAKKLRQKSRKTF